jgi:soluble lytic murein transglycosylase-like protein
MRYTLSEISFARKEAILSIYTLPPLVVVLISTLLIFLFLRLPSPSTARIAEITQQQQPSDVIPPVIALLFTPEVQHWAPKIKKWAKTFELDPNLIATVMQIESCGDPRAKSPAGAMGLFQVMPFHFKTTEDPYIPETNARRGLSYLLAALEAREGDVRYGLAGYNAGISGARRPERLWPAETRRYIQWGMAIYEDAKMGKQSSPALEEWLAKGGQSLCDQARMRLGITP